MKNGMALSTGNEKCANHVKIAEFVNGLISLSDQWVHFLI